jgi:hypothetical protein
MKVTGEIHCLFEWNLVEVLAHLGRVDPNPADGIISRLPAGPAPKFKRPRERFVFPRGPEHAFLGGESLVHGGTPPW